MQVLLDSSKIEHQLVDAIESLEELLTYGSVENEHQVDGETNLLDFTLQMIFERLVTSDNLAMRHEHIRSLWRQEFGRLPCRFIRTGKSQQIDDEDDSSEEDEELVPTACVKGLSALKL